MSDLISREALKKEIEQYQIQWNKNCESDIAKWDCCESILAIIDHAPTVPQDCSDCKRYDFPYFEVKFDKEQMQELVDKAKAEVLASIERPQGEWIEDVNDTYSYDHDTWECSVCHEPFTLIEGTPKDNLYNFCPNCGADMREAES